MGFFSSATATAARIRLAFLRRRVRATGHRLGRRRHDVSTSSYDHLLRACPGTRIVDRSRLAAVRAPNSSFRQPGHLDCFREHDSYQWSWFDDIRCGGGGGGIDQGGEGGSTGTGEGGTQGADGGGQGAARGLKTGAITRREFLYSGKEFPRYLTSLETASVVFPAPWKESSAVLTAQPAQVGRSEVLFRFLISARSM